VTAAANIADNALSLVALMVRTSFLQLLTAL